MRLSDLLWSFFLVSAVVGSQDATVMSAMGGVAASNPMSPIGAKIAKSHQEGCVLPDSSNSSHYDVCSVISDSCDNSVYNFAIYYYCHSDEQPATMAVLMSVLMVLFLSLGVSASDFLYPNLNYISNYLNLDERVAGMTLLSLGNSTPDIFSTYNAITSGSTSLAIGELIGAALLVVSLVVGIMAIISPFTVNRRDFLRDIGFFTMLITVSLYFIVDGKLTLNESILMVVLYCLYVFCILYYNEARESPKPSELPASPVLSRTNSYQNGRISPVSPLFRRSPSPSGSFPMTPNVVRFSVHDILQVWATELPLPEISEVSSEDDENRIYSQIYDNSDVSQLPSVVVSESPESMTLPTHIHHPELIREVLNPAKHHNIAIETPTPMKPAVLKVLTSNLEPETGETEQTHNNATNPIEDEHSGSMSLGDLGDESMFRNLLPEFETIKRSHIFSILISLVSMPIMVLLTLTVPVPNNGHLTRRSVKLYHFHISAIPFMFNYFFPVLSLWKLAIIAGVLVTVFHVVIRKTCRNVELPITEESQFSVVPVVSAIVGFILSLAWISVFSSLVIKILKNLGVIWDISESLLGLTLFAIGNSIGDLISNTTLARLGLSLTGFGACFGAPLLYILFGIGFNGVLIMMSRNRHVIEFRVSWNVIISSCGLLAILAFYLVVVPLNGWRFNRRIGYVGVFWWVMISVVNVVVG